MTEGADGCGSVTDGADVASTSSGGSDDSSFVAAGAANAPSNSSSSSGSSTPGGERAGSGHLVSTPAAAAAASPGRQTEEAGDEADFDQLDGNQLHTALSAAVNAEDYSRAQRACCWFVSRK